MFIIKYRKIFYTITAVLVGVSVGAVLFFGVVFGIDFTGGAIMEVQYTEKLEKTELEVAVSALPLGTVSFRQTGENGYLVRTRDLKDSEREALEAVLSQNGAREMSVERFSSVGPSIGKELRIKALWALAVVVLVIVLYVAFVFRKVSKPISSWKYGLMTIIALLHDITLPVGVFAVLGFVEGAEIDTLFVMALLAVLGYSVNDTIIIFDRIRENLKKNIEEKRKEDFEMTVGKSLNQTYARSLNTSVTTVLALLALFFLGPVATQNFALTLIVGVAAGAYSSLALAAPLLVTLEKWRYR
jgi:preprotein translocase subunit SecF